MTSRKPSAGTIQQLSQFPDACRHRFIAGASSGILAFALGCGGKVTNGAGRSTGRPADGGSASQGGRDSLPESQPTGGSSTATTGSSVGSASGSDARVWLTAHFTMSEIRGTDPPESHTYSYLAAKDGPPMPERPWLVPLRIGDCELNLETETKECVEACDDESYCNVEGRCQLVPNNISMGPIHFTGLARLDSSSSFSLSPLNNDYQLLGEYEVAFPACGIGTLVTLSGGESIATPFSIATSCVERLELSGTGTETVPFDPSQATTVTWKPPAFANRSRISAEFTVATSLKSSNRIFCDTEDTGTLTVSPDLIAALLDLGYGGRARMRIRRYSTASAPLGLGAATLTIDDARERALAIPGFTPCGDSSGCPLGQQCLAFKCVAAP